MIPLSSYILLEGVVQLAEELEGSWLIWIMADKLRNDQWRCEAHIYGPSIWNVSSELD